MKNRQRPLAPKVFLAAIASLIVMFAAISVSVMAAPLFNIPMTVEQPDGTTLDAFVSGDEFFNYLHDSEGRIIIQHPETGFWVYATLDGNGILSPSSRVAINDGRFYDANSLARMAQPISAHGITTADIDFGINSHLVRSMDTSEEITPLESQGIEPATFGVGMVRGNPISGTIENIVILITFDGEPYTISPTLAGVIEDRFNGPQSSLRSYMYAASDGVLTLNSTLVGMNNNTVIMYRDTQPRGYFMPVSASNPIGYNPTPVNGITEGHIRGQHLLARAIEAIDGSALLAGRVLNTIHSSRVDSVTFVLTGDPGAWASFLWPHAWSLQHASASLNGVAVSDYSLLMLGASYPFSTLRRSVIVHEQLHVFGMPDFYRYAHVGRPVGHWDIMSHNSDDLFQFSNTHAMRRYVGWGDPPVEITNSGTFTLHPLGASSGDTAFVIPIENRPNEFMLLEYRSSVNPTAYDRFQVASSGDYRAGLVITRINTGFRGNADSASPDFGDEVYIFRPGTTVRNAATSNVALASLSATTGRTAFGDAQGTGYLGIIYTHEGYNTGIEIYNVSVAGNTISFSVYLGASNITSLSPEMALRAAVASAGGTPTVIYLTQDITLSEVQAPLLIPNGANVILRGAGGVRRYISAGGNFNAIQVGENILNDPYAYLTLENIGVTRTPNTTGNGIFVSRNGHLTLDSGIITGHNRGAVENQGVFVMEGGEISGNTAIGNPAGGVTNWNVFTMYGGTISGNTGAFSGGVRNSVVTVNSVRVYGTFTMEGGVITNNTATGPNGGGGVSNTAIFNMNDGMISHNTATGQGGGGVTNMVSTAVFTMAGGDIYHNIVTGSGGGVLNMSAGTFIMEGGTISYNSSSNWSGGVSNSSAFTMSGGYIRNNSTGQNGGGIGLIGGHTFSFHMTGGEISGNSAIVVGGIGISSGPLSVGGPSVASITVLRDALDTGRFTIGANAVFANNNTITGSGIRYHAPEDAARYAANIHGTQWTCPFTQGFNNFDIQYWAGTGGNARPINFVLGGTESNPTTPQSIDTIRVFINTLIMQAPSFPADPTRVGYTFAGWYLNPGFTQALTPATNMPNNNDTRLYARWEKAMRIIVNLPTAYALPGTQVAGITATVVDGINPPQTVTWTIEGNNSFLTHLAMTWQGLGLVICHGETSGTQITVRATSTVDTNISGTARVTITTENTHEIHLMPFYLDCCCFRGDDKWQFARERAQRSFHVPHGNSLQEVFYVDRYSFGTPLWRDAITSEYYFAWYIKQMPIYAPRIFTQISRRSNIMIDFNGGTCHLTGESVLAHAWIYCDKPYSCGNDIFVAMQWHWHGVPDPQLDDHILIGWYEVQTGRILATYELPFLHICELSWIDFLLKEGYPFVWEYRAIWEPTSQGNLPCPTTNLARDIHGAVMSASSYMPARPHTRANNGIRDGAATQSWSATGIGQEWLQVDFGEVRNFNHIRIYQGGNRIMNYSFQYSNDGITWTTIRSGTRIMEATPNYYEFTHHTTIQARYVRLVSGNSTGATPIVVFEFEVYYMQGV
ncbi:MAG: discoidin domain-containing protein [Defluviitaleaceae bacterium]|nr:discoidin domain-containing protein [Defluviitaleaceae bacterium]